MVRIWECGYVHIFHVILSLLKHHQTNSMGILQRMVLFMVYPTIVHGGVINNTMLEPPVAKSVHHLHDSYKPKIVCLYNDYYHLL